MGSKEHWQHMAVAVGIHEPGNAAFAHVAEISDSDFEVVRGQGDRFAVKVSRRDDLHVIVVIDKDERVVIDGIELDIDNPAGISNGIADGTVNLGDAAQGVGVLDVAEIVLLHQSAPGQKFSQKGGAIDLAGMGTDSVNALIESPVGSVEGLQAEAGRNFGGVGQIDWTCAQGGLQGQPLESFRWSGPGLPWLPAPAV